MLYPPIDPYSTRDLDFDKLLLEHEYAIIADEIAAGYEHGIIERKDEDPTDERRVYWEIKVKVK